MHSIAHLAQQVLDFGPASEVWEFPHESLLGFLKHAGVQNRTHPEAAIASRWSLHLAYQVLQTVVQVGAAPAAGAAAAS